MSTLKTKIDETEVLLFLQKKIDPGITSLEFLKGGEMSQAFAYALKDKQYVIRINSEDYSFKKDKYAYENYNSPQILIPKIVSIGTYNHNLKYCISEKIHGNTLDSGKDENRQYLVQLFNTILQIQNIKLSLGNYGWWDEKGNANFKTWKDYILHKKDDIYSNWDELEKTTFLEKSIVDAAYSLIENLLEYVPEERVLVHADMGYDNVFFENGKVSGVIDWGESLYGDGLCDIAFLHFWSSSVDISNEFKVFAGNSGRIYENYEERMKCYMLFLGVGAIGFFAKSGQKEKYDKSKKRIEELLSISPRNW